MQDACGKGSWISHHGTIETFDCVEHPLAGKRSKLRADTAED